MEIEKHWQEIFGEAMPPEILTRVLKIQKIMNIKDNDALWQILIPLEFYQNLYQVWPASVRMEVEAVMVRLREASGQVVKEAGIEIQKAESSAKVEMAKALNISMAEAVQAALDHITHAVHVQNLKVQARKWALVGAVTAVLVLGTITGGAAWYAFQAGKVAGLVMATQLKHYVYCDGTGWETKKGKGGEIDCIPRRAKDGTLYGWRLK